MKTKIYFDTASSTRLRPEVLNAYTSLLKEHYVNADALYDDGVKLYNLQDNARQIIADLLAVRKNEIIFTSGASEANNFALKGVAFTYSKGHIITSIYEHSSVYSCARQLEKMGYEVTYLSPDKLGCIDPEDVRRALRQDTILVSIMYVNNEIGSINDICAIKDIVKKESRAYFHCDITQAIGKIPLSLKDIDLASFSAHKIHGLKGSGVLIKKQHVKIEPLIAGGQQEFFLRGGTANAASNIVLAKTLRMALEELEEVREYITTLKERMLIGLKTIKGVKIFAPESSIYCLLNITTPLKSEVLLNALNSKGIMVSSRSTCGSRKNEPSRVLTSVGIDDDYAIRISFDAYNKPEEVDYFLDVLKESIAKYG